MSTSEHQQRVSVLKRNELAEWLRKPEKDFLIVDVRDIDFFGQKIPGSYHASSEIIVAEISILLQKISAMEKKPEKVIFYCQHCDDRGPTAARIFSKQSFSILPSATIYFLEGGWNAWKNEYEKVPGMMEEITESQPF
ncbi:putative Cdc25 family phosphatase [Monocercomonoides exilis]|uniref:putative Cdc25 family phosphatase n=1 Tax=Monocercomonoides exilis TaxID=2049356 RepID=UPI00355A4CC5|nr:putative Cdc25 family phosphatase [Monocercomonoides exilis]